MDPITRLNAALEGRYRIESELGEGGMATVYLADDLKHERKVALKVLKPDLAAVVGAERFLAEIKTTANLQHPHILPLFDSGEADSFLFYVMPYVEGEDLRQKLDREHQLPVDEAVQVATNMAEALDYAHRQGVVHRDIKPANVLLLDGKPVIADFGIALAVGVAGGGRLTETGLSIGTPFYMSPEQATGDQDVGPASDTYALAAMLYEMLTGDPPYIGSTAQAVLGKIIQGAPVSATELRKSVPRNVDAAIRKALEKLPADRFTGAQDFAKALREPTFRHGESAVAGVGAGVGPWKRMTLAATVLAASFAVALGWALLRPAPPMPVERFESPFRVGQGPIAFAGGAYDLSPDGSFLVYRGPSAQGNQLWVRRWNDLDATPIRGTEGGNQPAISPDGQEVAFSRGGEVAVVSLAGGPVRTVASGLWPTWGPDGFIYVTGADRSIVSVPSTGGPVVPVTELAEGDVGHYLAQTLPGGRLLFMAQLGRGFEVRTVSLETGEMEFLVAGLVARYVATGHLLFLDNEESLFAAPFQPGSLELGASVPISETVAFYAISESGKLVYTSGGGASAYTVVWVDRDGRTREVDPGWVMPGQPQYTSLSLSPDGGRLAVSFEGDNGFDLWVKQLDQGPLTRLTTVGGVNRRATWSPDGRSLLFQSNREGSNALWTTRADGSAEDQFVLGDERGIFQAEYSPDGEWLVYRVDTNSIADGNPDVYAMRVGVDSVGTPVLASEFIEWEATISPDGRWLAYVSNQSGQREVYVRPFPDASAARYPVSTDGGREPRWAPDGSELFFRNGSDELVAASFSDSDGFAVAALNTLFALDEYLASAGGYRMYDVTADGQTFVMLRSTSVSSSGLVLVNNFFEELKGLVPN